MLALRRRISNDLREIPDLLVELQEALKGAGFAATSVYWVVLSLDEALTNVVSYAFPEGGEHFIDISLEQAEDVVTVCVTDRGMPFDPTAQRLEADTTTSLDQRDLGGLGIHLLSTFMDDIVYERRGDQNRLVMKKTLARE